MCSRRREATTGKRLGGNVNPNQHPHFVHLVVSESTTSEVGNRGIAGIYTHTWHPGTMISYATVPFPALLQENVPQKPEDLPYNFIYILTIHYCRGVNLINGRE